MARVKEINRYRVPASSILEVVVSMVIIVMVLGVSLMIYTNVMRQSLSARQLKAQFLLRQAMIQAETAVDKEVLVIDGWEIREEIAPYEAGSDLQVMHLTAYDPNQNLIAEMRKVILRKTHE